MKHRILVVLALLLALLVPMASVQAAPPQPLLPQSAADWASFTPAQQNAAMGWVWAQYRLLGIAEKLSARDHGVGNPFDNIGGGPPNPFDVFGLSKAKTSKTAIRTLPFMPYGSVVCGINKNNQSWGTYSNAWAQAYVSAPVFAIDTGITGGYWDTFYRSGRYVQSFGAGGGGTQAYAQSVTDFKWAWENVQYSIQAWGSAQFQPGVWVYRLRSCYSSATA